MIKILLATILILMLTVSGLAQNKKSSAKGNVPKQKADTVQLSNLSRSASELEESAGSNLACGGVSTYTGTVLKREFDENEVMLIGFVIREASDVRTFVNIDVEQVTSSDGLLGRKLSLILGKGKKVKIWAIGCENGNSAALAKSLFLNKVKTL